MEKEIMDKVIAGQSYITTTEDLSGFGYWRNGGKPMVWALTKVRKAMSNYGHDYGKTAFEDCVRRKRRHPAQSVEIQKKYWKNKLIGDAEFAVSRGFPVPKILYEGENFGDVFLVGHHITNEYVIYIPRDFHLGCYTGDREKHRWKVMRELEDNHRIIFHIIMRRIREVQELRSVLY